MLSSATLRSQRLEPARDVFLLCDLTDVIEFFRESLMAGRLLEMPVFVAYGRTPVLLGITRGVNLDLGIETMKTAARESNTNCP